MKQNITPEQFREVPVSKLEKLVIWAVSEGYNAELLSIGQMIEFLRDNNVMMGIKWALDNDDMCDRLWEAVKEVLEK